MTNEEKRGEKSQAWIRQTKGRPRVASHFVTDAQLRVAMTIRLRFAGRQGLPQSLAAVGALVGFCYSGFRSKRPVSRWVTIQAVESMKIDAHLRDIDAHIPCQEFLLASHRSDRRDAQPDDCKHLSISGSIRALNHACL